MKERVGRAFLFDWTSCIGSAKNCPKAHRGAFQGEEGVANFSLEVWLIVDFGSGMHGSECLGQTMILIFWIALRFSIICQLEGLQKYTLPSTTNNTIWGII